MKITKVEAIPLMAPADRVIAMSQATIRAFYTTIVRITTDDGITGIGECMVRTAPSATKSVVDDMLTPVIIGKDPLDVEAIFDQLLKKERHRGHSTGLYMEAISGVDTAIWDIIGKYHKMPVGKLLGGYDRKSVKAYGSSVMLTDIEAMADRAHELVEQGFRSMKIKVGTDRKNDAAIIHRMRDVVGDEIELMADANSYYGLVGDALYVGRAMEEADYLFFEEPMYPDNLEDYATLAGKLDIAIAAGESNFTSLNFRTMLEKRCVEIVQPDVTRCGGITESRRIADLARAFNKQYAPHTGLSSSVCVFATLQLVAWAPNFNTYEYGLFGNPLQRITTKPIPPVVNGEVAIPQEPGIGCELDEDCVERYRLDR